MNTKYELIKLVHLCFLEIDEEIPMGEIEKWTYRQKEESIKYAAQVYANSINPVFPKPSSRLPFLPEKEY